jgi:hypothetical protein
MKKICAVALGITLSLFTPRPAVAADDLSNDDVDEIKANLNCLKFLHKRYCAALDEFKKGKPPKVDPLTIYVGSSFTRAYKGNLPSLSEEVGYLVIGKEGATKESASKESATYGPIVPETFEERKKTENFLYYLQQSLPVPANNEQLKEIQGLKATDELLQRRPAKFIGKSLHYSDDWGDTSRRIYIRDIKDALVVIQVAVQYGIDPNVSKLPLHVGIFRKENKKSF